MVLPGPVPATNPAENPRGDASGDPARVLPPAPSRAYLRGAVHVLALAVALVIVPAVPWPGSIAGNLLLALATGLAGGVVADFLVRALGRATGHFARSALPLVPAHVLLVLLAFSLLSLREALPPVEAYVVLGLLVPLVACVLGNERLRSRFTDAVYRHVLHELLAGTPVPITGAYAVDRHPFYARAGFDAFCREVAGRAHGYMVYVPATGTFEPRPGFAEAFAGAFPSPSSGTSSGAPSGERPSASFSLEMRARVDAAAWKAPDLARFRARGDLRYVRRVDLAAGHVGVVYWPGRSRVGLAVALVATVGLLGNAWGTRAFWGACVALAVAWTSYLAGRVERFVDFTAPAAGRRVVVGRRVLWTRRRSLRALQSFRYELEVRTRPALACPDDFFDETTSKGTEGIQTYAVKYLPSWAACETLVNRVLARVTWCAVTFTVTPVWRAATPRQWLPVPAASLSPRTLRNATVQGVLAAAPSPFRALLGLLFGERVLVLYEALDRHFGIATRLHVPAEGNLAHQDTPRGKDAPHDPGGTPRTPGTPPAVAPAPRHSRLRFLNVRDRLI